jgi:NitT/TauT family transport system permease protein
MTTAIGASPLKTGELDALSASTEPTTSPHTGSISAGSDQANRAALLRALARVGRASAGPLLMAAALIAIWWLAVVLTGTSIIVAPSPLDVWHDFLQAPGTYLSAALATLRTALVGLAVGVACGTLLAIAKWWSSILGGLTELPALFFRSVPFVALVPVASRVFGYGPRTTLLITAIIAFFPSFALVDSGMRNVPPGSPELFAVIGSARSQRLFRLALPSALPQAATALRLSATMCILGAMSSEYLTQSGGLGALYGASRISYLHPARGWTIAVVTALMSFIAFGLASTVERRARTRFAPL